MTTEIKEAVERIEKNKVNPSKDDFFLLVDNYNKYNSDSYTYKDIAACSDCRRGLFEFWLHIKNEWIKIEQNK